MKYLKYCIIILAIVSISSCSDYLDIKPKGLTIPTFIDDFDLMLNKRRVDNLYEQDFSQLLTDNFSFEDDARGSYWESWLSPYQRSLYTFEPGQVYDGNTSSSFTTWGKSYEVIFITNYIIENLPDAPAETDTDKEHKKNVLADARVTRAHRYFILVNYYAKQFNAATASTDLGVPLITVPDAGGKAPARSSVQEVYDFIIDEITDALDDLPEWQPNIMRLSKPAGMALLAQVYFQKEDYAMAQQYAEKVLNDYPQYNLLDYNLSSSSEGYPQSEGPWNRRDSYFFATFMGGFYYNFFSDEYLALFDGPENAGDLRPLKVFSSAWTPFGSASAFQELGYIENAGLFVQEMVLIAAESNARNDNLDEALAHLNHLREHRFDAASYTAKSSTDKLEILGWIIDEKRRELPMTHRLLEIKRLNNDPDFAKQIVHVINGQTYTLEINDEKLILPIPPGAEGFNPDWELYSRN